MKKSQPHHRTSSLIEDKDKQNQAFKQLKELYLLDQRKRFPSVPVYGIVSPKYTDTNTNGLTKCVVDYIKLKGYFVERTSNTGRLIDNHQTFKDVLGYSKTIGSVKWIKGSGTNGTSDLKAIIKNLFVAIEIKCLYSHDRQRPEQIRYQQQVEQAGGIYYIARDFASFFDWFNQTFGGN